MLILQLLILTAGVLDLHQSSAEQGKEGGR